MISKDISVIHQFVDTALETWRQADLMRLPRAVPLEMRDETGVVHNDWIPWKPIPSTVTESDIKELEDKINLQYPDLYKEFLRYKHFYELWSVKEIEFFPHGIYEWKAELLNRYFESWDPTKLIDQGYIYFANYSDWGMVCFDTNNQNRKDHDCPIVMIDHESLYDEPVPLEILYPSFIDMIRNLVAEQEDPTQLEE